MVGVRAWGQLPLPDPHGGGAALHGAPPGHSTQQPLRCDPLTPPPRFSQRRGRRLPTTLHTLWSVFVKAADRPPAPTQPLSPTRPHAGIRILTIEYLYKLGGSCSRKGAKGYSRQTSARPGRMSFAPFPLPHRAAPEADRGRGSPRAAGPPLLPPPRPRHRLFPLRRTTAPRVQLGSLGGK